MHRTRWLGFALVVVLAFGSAEAGSASAKALPLTISEFNPMTGVTSLLAPGQGVILGRFTGDNKAEFTTPLGDINCGANGKNQVNLFGQDLSNGKPTDKMELNLTGPLAYDGDHEACGMLLTPAAGGREIEVAVQGEAQPWILSVDSKGKAVLSSASASRIAFHMQLPEPVGAECVFERAKLDGTNSASTGLGLFELMFSNQVFRLNKSVSGSQCPKKATMTWEALQISANFIFGLYEEQI
jgi:hypothetical protein